MNVISFTVRSGAMLFAGQDCDVRLHGRTRIDRLTLLTGRSLFSCLAAFRLFIPMIYLQSFTKRVIPDSGLRAGRLIKDGAVNAGRPGGDTRIQMLRGQLR